MRRSSNQNMCRYFFLSILLCFACHPKTTLSPPRATEYQDHTKRSLSSSEELLSLSLGDSRAELKFVITDFEDTEASSIFYLDSTFYRLHDEWYWFRLLNGQRIQGLERSPVNGESFETIAEIYERYKLQRLPLDLAWTADGRLYSEGFYPDCFGRRRFFGIGSLLYIPKSKSQEEVLAFQLELTDSPTREQLEHFFSMLESSLPAELSGELVWLPRSVPQKKLAKLLQEDAHPLAARLTTLDMMKMNQRTEVYNEGLTAGYLRLLQYNTPTVGSTKPDDILVMQYTPTFLPTAAGLITGDPQTPLAHINILAKNRKIPNVYVGDIFADAGLSITKLANQPVVLQAIAPDQVKVTEISKEQLNTWKELQQKRPLSQKRDSTKGAPLLYSLKGLSIDDKIRAFIGGKAAGFALLYSVPEVEPPPNAVVLTTRSYDEHVESLAPMIKAIVEDKGFQSDARVRFLALEGKKKYLELYPDKRFTMRKFLWRHRKDGVKEMTEKGGLTDAIRDKEMNPETLKTITDELQKQFVDLSPMQGLRFRSSSTLEDIEGFNAAGLYLSSSGFLSPEKAGKKKKTIEKAIKEVWASYWSFEATEERQQEAIEHTGGAMAIVIHPRFEDDAEQSNAVITFSILPENKSRMQLNIQQGAISVTNPNARDLPEVDEVIQTQDETPQIIRKKRSTLSKSYLVSDEELRTLFLQAKALTMAAMKSANQGLSLAQRHQTFTLDIELRQVKEGWPQLASGEELPARFIFKQARSLEPEVRGMPKEVFTQDIPRDVLARARKLEQHICTSDALSMKMLSIFTDPSSTPNFGYSKRPFTAMIELTSDAKTTTITASQLASIERPVATGKGAWALRAVLTDDAAKSTGIAQLHVDESNYVLWRATNEQQSGALRCETKVLFSTPSSYLLDLLKD